jgi:Protein of unknown function (DUF1566)
MTYTLRNALTALTLSVAACSSQAALVDRGGGMIYDTTMNITWLADMNYAVTSGYAAGGTAPDSVVGSNAIWTDGRMGWAAANQWANNLVFGGYDDWRLPTVNLSDTSCSNTSTPAGFPTQYYGYNCAGGELSQLFTLYMGEKMGESVLDQTGDTAEQIANQALFSNLKSSGYWTSQEYAPDRNLAWRFGTQGGLQLESNKSLPLYAVAVRAGDVPSTLAVPEPQTLALVMTALGAALLCRGRRRR